ncbi:TPA: flagellar assembly protein FlgT [Photobacterium damselae]
MKKILVALLNFSVMLGGVFSLPAHAKWLEVTGQAVILESESTARINALEDAIYQAMIFSGADIATLSNIKPYLSEKNKEYRFSGNEVRQVSVLKTDKQGGKFYLTARIDIYPAAKSCHKTQYKKPLLLSDFTLLSQQQAIMGGIYQVGEDFTTMLKRQIQQRSQSFVVAGTTHIPFNANNPSMMMMLAEDKDAQYLISGQITDISATLDQKLLKKDQVNRQFATSMTIMDGKTGEILFEKNYRDIALWPFSRTSTVDTKSARFWQSPYGLAVERVSRNMMLDLENALSCRASLPEIVSAHGNMAQMNVGRIHGVKEGDRLKLWHSASFIDQMGIPRTRMVATQLTLIVNRVYEKSAELIINQPDLAASIQTGDLLTKQVKR